MKFSMGAEDLSRTLQSVVSAVPPKSTLPILSNFLIEAADGVLHLTCTDLDMAVCTRAASKTAANGRVTVPARRFTEIVKELPGDEIQVASDDLKVTVDCTIGQFTLMGMDADEFPKVPEVGEGTRVQLKGSALARGIRYSSYAVGTDDARPVLNGVLLEVRDGEMRLVATDGHRLAWVTLRDSALEKAGTAIVVPKTLQLVQRLVGDGSDAVTMVVTDKHVMFEVGETTVYSRLIDGPFPKYEQVVPRDNPSKLVVDRQAIISAVRRVSILADSITHQVKLGLFAKRVELRVQTADVGEGLESIEADYDGEEMTVGFNASYLLEALKGMDSDKIMMAFKEETSAVLVQPAEQAEDEEITCLVMPIKLMD
ncbi:MAG: DNA polymerase III subunit beta [Candidatus Eiseniibacteriota bacterium]|jgi:DNA polymerase-3 subunit beta